MFEKLRKRIIIITMAVTTGVLVVAGVFIMLFSSAMRPEPKPLPEPDFSVPNPAIYDNQEPKDYILYDSQELKDYIRTDREEGSVRLLVTLLAVGAIVEIVVFVTIYKLSQKIVEPVENSYKKQKIFIANASHELKTPLAIIGANTEALEVDKNNEKWKANIETEVAHANKLVLDLLQLAKMDAGETNGSLREQVDLESLVRERTEIFKPRFAGKITLSIKEKDFRANISRQDFLQVLDILLDNATKYGDRKISVILGDGEIAVANDGTTIKNEDLEKVFDRFYQTDKTKEGSGLGLAIAKAVCERNGWGISCQSNKNLTMFVVKLL